MWSRIAQIPLPAQIEQQKMKDTPEERNGLAQGVDKVFYRKIHNFQIHFLPNNEKKSHEKKCECPLVPNLTVNVKKSDIKVLEL